MGSAGQPSSRTQRSLSSGLSDLSSGRFSSSQVNGLAQELAVGLGGAKLDDEHADRISASFRTIFEDAIGSEIPVARAEMETSLSEAGVGKDQLAKIQQELTTLLSSGPRMSEQQQRNVDKLADDLAAIRAGSNVTPEQVQKLSQDLMAMAEGANRPSPESVDALARDLAEALEDGKLTKREQIQLAKALEDVLTSANVSPEEFAAVVEDIEQILVSSGVSRSDVAVIRADLEAIYEELRRMRP
jgi:hypothetical protein